jgi:methionine aminopeptidase
LCGRSFRRQKEVVEDYKRVLYLGIENAVAGKHIGDIGSAIQAAL